MSQFAPQPEHKELGKNGKKPHNSWLIFNLILPKPTTDDFQLSVQPIRENGQRDILGWPSNSSLEPGEGGESSLINAGSLSNGIVRQVPQFIESIKRNIGRHTLSPALLHCCPPCTPTTALCQLRSDWDWDWVREAAPRRQWHAIYCWGGNWQPKVESSPQWRPVWLSVLGQACLLINCRLQLATHTYEGRQKRQADREKEKKREGEKRRCTLLAPA